MIESEIERALPSLFAGPNAGYAAELYERYRQDPQSVDAETRALFDTGFASGAAQSAPPPSAAHVQRRVTAADETACPPLDERRIEKIVGAARVTRMVRELGHLAARIDPLGSPPPGDPNLLLETHGLEPADLEELPASVVGGPLAEGAPNALAALARLREAYSGTVGYEDDHIQVAAERNWLREAVESGRFFRDIDAEKKRLLLERLSEVEAFETYLGATYIAKKRFSIEGVDILVPMLDEIIHDACCSDTGGGATREIVVGMAHRGRLNVLAHILGKPYAAILSEFEHHGHDENASVSGAGTRGYSGDVKYHLGARRVYSEEGGVSVPITLAPNPSHLEYVDPVVVGRARAAQERRDRPGRPVRDIKASLAILIHGDAAFPGQGIVAETLNLSQLSGYRVGGTIHIITNNQIGFTTAPRDSRSTLYASDLAKGFEIPIVHVNADDVIACIAIARMAAAYRDKFGKDFLIDLVGYRRWGHNEGDEPAYTQPRLYDVIRKHPTVRQLWAERLDREGIVAHDEAEQMVRRVQDALREARKQLAGGQPGDTESSTDRSQAPADTAPDAPHSARRGAPSVSGNGHEAPLVTAVPAERLRELNEMLLIRPEGFTSNPKLEGGRTGFQSRRRSIEEQGGINWAHAESLAFASLLADGTSIRLTGQDTERGTFSHRHLVLHDPATGERFCPLQALPAARASFALYNSPLSENACVAFEYGYSMHARGALVIWEAQFGDFANGAQVIIDQFIAAGMAKWHQTPSLVLLLPHGYEGQGPEHSSGRLERYLQLAADGNLRVANCTTSAQYFHLLRRQAALVDTEPRPLIVMTPKSLLRHPRAGSSLAELAEGRFQPVLDGPTAADRRQSITRLVLCSGKVYVDLTSSPDFATAERVAVARVEQLYPFPAAELGRVVSGYPALREVVWLQEEPRNMGAWSFVAPLVRGAVQQARKDAGGMDVAYVGRPAAASPAEGVEDQHVAEQARIVSEALSGAPTPAAPARPRKNGAAPAYAGRRAAHGAATR